MFSIRQPAGGAWKWKSRADLCASSPGGFTEFGRSKRVKTDEGKKCHICKYNMLQ